MAIFDIGKTCVFSSVTGQLTRDGEPMRHVQIIRRWEWQTLKEDSTITDENGCFAFPAVYEQSLMRLLPIELVIAQGLYVVEQNEEKKIWSNSKRDPKENAEFNGRPNEMVCEMTNEMKAYKESGSRVHTLCEW